MNEKDNVLKIFVYYDVDFLNVCLVTSYFSVGLISAKFYIALYVDFGIGIVEVGRVKLC